MTDNIEKFWELNTTLAGRAAGHANLRVAYTPLASINATREPAVIRLHRKVNEQT